MIWIILAFVVGVIVGALLMANRLLPVLRDYVATAEILKGGLPGIIITDASNIFNTSPKPDPDKSILTDDRDSE